MISVRERPIFRCARCNRQSPGFALTLCRGELFCLQHYFERRLELHYDADKPFRAEWREQCVAEICAQHPEWERQPEETASAYAERMLVLAKELAKGAGLPHLFDEAEPPRTPEQAFDEELEALRKERGKERGGSLTPDAT